MFFWGKDAIHPQGNLFLRTGFRKRESTGLQGTSCYRLPWQNGALELHGSHAGWLNFDGGIFFLRPLAPPGKLSNRTIEIGCFGERRQPLRGRRWVLRGIMADNPFNGLGSQVLIQAG